MLARKPAPALAALVLLALPACEGCRDEPVVDRLTLVPGDSLAVIHVEGLAALPESLKQVLARFGPYGEQLAVLLRAYEAGLGFHPLDPEGPERLGLDPGGGLTIYRRPGAAGISGLVVRVKDEDRLREGLLALQKRGGASNIDVVEHGDAEITIVERPYGVTTTVSAALAFRGGYALIGYGLGAVKEVARMLDLKVADSLAATRWHAELTSPLPPRAPVRLVATLRAFPGRERLVRQAAAVVQGFALDLHPRAGEIGIAAYIRLKRGTREALAELGDTPPGALLPGVPDDSVLALQIGGEPSHLAQLARRHGGGFLVDGLAELLASAGLSLEDDILSRLGGDTALGVAAGDLKALARVLALPPEQMLSAADQLLRVVLVSRLKNPDSPVVARVAAALRRSHLPFDEIAPGHIRATLPATLDLAQTGGWLLYGVGEGAVAKGQDAVAGKAALSARLEDDVVAGMPNILFIDLGRLARETMALPREAFGQGVRGFLVKRVVDRVLGIAAYAGELRLGARPQDQGLLLRGSLLPGISGDR